MSTIETPTSIGSYRIGRKLGEGGMGCVYQSVHPTIGRRVAIKIMHPELCNYAGRAQNFIERFVREGEVLRKLDHPGIIKIYEAAQEREMAYIVMEYIDAPTLKTFLKVGKRVDEATVVAIGVQICTALAYIHTSHVIHRDIKPANIFLLPYNYVKIADFGIAHVDGSDLTEPGQQIGSLCYMSQEQFQGKRVDCRSDLFSVGVILCEMLTGHAPRNARQLSNEDRRELELLAGNRLNRVLIKALQEDPDARYLDGKTMADGLRESINQDLAPEATKVSPVKISSGGYAVAKSESFDEVITKKKQLDWPGIGWGDAISLLDCPTPEGWPLDAVTISWSGLDDFRLPTEMMTRYKTYCAARAEDSQSIEALRNRFLVENLGSTADPNLMLAERPTAFTDRLPLNLFLRRTSYSVVQFYEHCVATAPAERHECLKKLRWDYEVSFAHSLCLHILVVTADRKALLTRRLPKGKIDHAPDKWSASIEEQISETKDLWGQNSPMRALTTRALLEELKLSPEEYDESRVRILSVFLESNLLNISLCGYAELRITEDQLTRALLSRRRPDTEFTSWGYIDIARVPLLAAILQDNAQAYHPTSVFRLVQAFQKNYGDPTAEDIQQAREYYQRYPDLLRIVV